MEVGFVSYIPLILVFVLFFLRVPVGFALVGSAMLYFIFMNNSMPIDLTLQTLIAGIQDFGLLAVPLFIMAGVIMNYSGISSRLMAFADLLVGHMAGGLGQVNVLLSTLMGGVSGSGNADTAMQCKILVPEMVKRGYDAPTAAAITATSSIIPAIIPPGIVMLLYCMAAHVSIGKVFAAGYIPGLLLCVALMITVHILAKKRGYPASRKKRATAKEIIQGAFSAILALFMPLGLLLGLRMGMFTATEGGAMAVAYCAIVGGFIYKELKFKHLWPIIKETYFASAEIMFIIIGAKLLGSYLSWEHIPDSMSDLVLAMTDNKILFLLFINIFFLFLGMFMEVSPCMFIFVPLLIGPLKALGIDLVHFGIIMTLNLMIGGITPPFGSMMFISCSLTKIPMEKFVIANIPFFITVLIVLLMVTYIEPISMFLPNLLF
ncbi:MAG TPA: TRAP transporter large permease [Peptococcaceae bacterium]|nr:TRAP transporter large permease [Peptococcaceae bacterium]